MADIVYPDVALAPIADRVLGAGVHFHLFNNNADVDKDTVLTDLTEPTVSGYAAQTVSAWTTQVIVLDHGLNQGADITFTNSEASTDETIYGYFATSTDDATLLWACKYDSPKNFPHGGGEIVVKPFFGDFSESPAE